MAHPYTYVHTHFDIIIMNKLEILQELPKCDTETRSEHKPLGKWRRQTCSTQGCYKPSIYIKETQYLRSAMKRGIHVWYTYNAIFDLSTAHITQMPYIQVAFVYKYKLPLLTDFFYQTCETRKRNISHPHNCIQERGRRHLPVRK
jgi:hypothetical protein